MKIRRFTPTKAKLPNNERIIGGDASPKLFRKIDLEKLEKEIQKDLKNHAKQQKNNRHIS